MVFDVDLGEGLWRQEAVERILLLVLLVEKLVEIVAFVLD